MSRLPRPLVSSLLVVHFVSVAMILRSALLHRWTTVVVAMLLLAGVRAALRERTWGIGLVLAAATAFPVAASLGFAPAWFWIVGGVGLVPFLLTLRAMFRFDVGATLLFGGLASLGGVVSAFAWREAAYAMYYAMLHHHCH